jgi:hypothetical protein
MRTTIMRIPIGVTLFAFAAACSFGTQPRDFTPATTPAGARAAIRVDGQTNDIVGELFAVDTIGVTIYDGILRRVSWRRLSAMDLKGLDSDYDVQFGEVISAEKRARIALVARFPQGLSDVVLRAVSAKTGQATLEEIK